MAQKARVLFVDDNVNLPTKSIMGRKKKQENLQTNRVFAFAARLAIAAIFLVLIAIETKAKTTCDELSQMLFELAVVAQGIYAANDAEQAVAFESRLEQAFNILNGPQFRGQMANDENPERKSKIASFVNSRERLLKIYRDKGIDAAKNYYFNKVVRLHYKKAISTLEEIQCKLDENNMDMEQLLDASNTNNLIEAKTESNVSTQGSGIRPGDGAMGNVWEAVLDEGSFKYVMVALAFMVVGFMFTLDHFENRKSPRYDVSIDTAVIFNEATNPVRIGNLSLFGARFGPNPGLAIGNAITINLAHGPVGAQVMWAGEDAVGIMFAKKLKKRQMKGLMGVQGPIPSSINPETPPRRRCLRP